MRVRNKSKRYVIAFQVVVERGNLEGKEPEFKWVKDIRFGVHETARECCLAFMRRYEPELASAPDDFVMLHWAKIRRNQGHFKVVKGLI